ncbi:AraC family transcriptional regulator [Aliikangiella sp. IMCC44359]|uniref:AraC family transcriptional regulator n=1 Tax=Aliikangiella sp. IMCC44359 TaxID=3459125 RepID=UPI00403B0395
MKTIISILVIIAGAFAHFSCSAEEEQTTAAKLESLKKEVLSVNRDLFILEEDLLFPASTQVAVYLSVDIGHFFALDNVKLKIDDKDVVHYLYTENDIDALHRGAIQKVYLGNLSTGDHQVVAIVIGKGPHNREYRRAIAFDFKKGSEAKALEIQLRDDTTKQQPSLNIVEW